VRENRIVHLQEVHAGTTAAQVQAQGVLLQRLAEQLSVSLKPLANQPPVAEAVPRKSAPAPAKPVEKEKDKIPMALPIRTDMEVFRF
jgi:hypothetical protein